MRLLLFPLFILLFWVAPLPLLACPTERSVPPLQGGGVARSQRTNPPSHSQNPTSHVENPTSHVENPPSHLESSASPLDTLAASPLSFQLDALFFMADNEFDGRLQRGFTLPGVQLTPLLAYRPHPLVRLEGGLHAHFYHGARKYPSYAFHDLPLWRGSDYQPGAHLLPHLRADVQLGSLALTLGTLHGRTQHDLVLPLYNPQSLLSTDPEQGVQLRLHRPRYRLDAWIDWQSFIFDGSDHQEVFVAGLSQRVQLLRPQAHGWQLSLPLQVLAQHRGGEQDRPDRGVQTLLNAALGLDLALKRPRHRLERIEWQALALLAHQRDGQLWPFKTGTALWAQTTAQWRLAPESRLRCSLGFFHAPGQFASLLGVPFFGTLSLKEPGGRLGRATTAHWQLHWQRHFGPRLALEAYALGYLLFPNPYTSPQGSPLYLDATHPLTLGLSLRWRPCWSL